MPQENYRQLFAVRAVDRDSVEDTGRRIRFIAEYSGKAEDLLSGKITRAYMFSHAKEGTTRPIPLQWRAPWNLFWFFLHLDTATRQSSLLSFLALRTQVVDIDLHNLVILHNKFTGDYMKIGPSKMFRYIIYFFDYLRSSAVKRVPLDSWARKIQA